MQTNDLLRGELQYRLLLASHSILRTMGFPAGDIYPCIGKAPRVMLKRDGIEFVISIGSSLDRPYDQFCAEFTYIVGHLHEIEDEIAARAMDDWRERFSLPGLIIAIGAKGITIPKMERPDRHELN